MVTAAQFVVHAAAKLCPETGNVSALCFDPPRSILPGRRPPETWTLEPGEVSCPACLALLDDAEIARLRRASERAASFGLDGSLRDLEDVGLQPEPEH